MASLAVLPIGAAYSTFPFIVKHLRLFLSQTNRCQTQKCYGSRPKDVRFMQQVWNQTVLFNKLLCDGEHFDRISLLKPYNCTSSAAHEPPEMYRKTAVR